jgi:hypothetical protein
VVAQVVGERTGEMAVRLDLTDPPGGFLRYGLQAGLAGIAVDNALPLRRHALVLFAGRIPPGAPASRTESHNVLRHQ